MKPRVLVVDDEVNLRKVLGALLRREGYEVVAACDGVEALETLRGELPFAAMLTDLRMPRLDGMGLLRQVLSEQPHLPVIVVTAHGTVDTAVEALKLGAFDFVTKPYDQDELRKILHKAVETWRLNGMLPDLSLQATEEAVQTTAEKPKGRFGIIGRSAAMCNVFELLGRIAPTPSTVLVEGESGTGKELVARALHAESPRAQKPFIKVNCAAIPQNLIESELFGYEKGAFTGAVTSKPGRFELADGGTLFLDEIGEINSEMQVKLLRAVQEGEFERVGGVRTCHVDVRLVTATNRDLAREVAEGRFREDLYYRLNVVPIRLPPLRDRLDDIPLLVDYILERCGARLGKEGRHLSQNALDWLCAQPWPGNVRQLENVLERTLLLSDSVLIEAEDLSGDALCGHAADARLCEATSVKGDAKLGLKDAVRTTTRRLERELCERALMETGGNVTQAAKLLEISRKSLQIKMKEFGLREEA